jgi:hypothetical protein
MISSRWWWLTASLLGLAVTNSVVGQNERRQLPPLPAGLEDPASSPAKFRAAKKQSCTVYALRDLGNDPDLGKWLADTIPLVVRPGTWGLNAAPAGGGQLSYYAPGGILVVRHTPAVQAEVAAFLRSVKKALPQARGGAASGSQGVAAKDSRLTQARYTVPHLLQTSGAEPSGASSYPVPPPLQQPKHLFHLIVHYDGDGIMDPAMAGLLANLSRSSPAKEESADKAKPQPGTGARARQTFNFIIRYEGEGLIDSTVADVLKTLYSAQNATKDSAEGNAEMLKALAPLVPSMTNKAQGEAAPTGCVAPNAATLSVESTLSRPGTRATSVPTTAPAASPRMPRAD